MGVATLGLRRATTAPVTAEVRDVDGRQIVWVELGGETASGFRGVPLSSTTSAIVEQAATVARTEGMPLVVVMASTGADIVEGVAALEGWGQLAKALVDCSGIVPDDHGRRRPGGVRTGAAARRRRPRRDDRDQLRVRQRPDDGRGVHRRARSPPTSSAAPASWPATPGVPSLVVADRDAAVDAVADLLAYLPQSVDDEPPRVADRRPGRPATARRPAR